MDSKRDAFAKLYAEKIKGVKPETRGGNDKRGREMSDDPMLEYFREKSGEKQGVSKEAPRYIGHCPLNRYNIRPGYRWDGVDRSNGFEKKLLDRDGQKRAREEDSYRDATRDL